jgi:hypothetical protein
VYSKASTLIIKRSNQYFDASILSPLFREYLLVKEETTGKTDECALCRLVDKPLSSSITNFSKFRDTGKDVEFLIDHPPAPHS